MVNSGCTSFANYETVATITRDNTYSVSGAVRPLDMAVREAYCGEEIAEGIPGDTYLDENSNAHLEMTEDGGERIVVDRAFERWSADEDGNTSEGFYDGVSSTLDDSVKSEITYRANGEPSPVDRKEDTGTIDYEGKMNDLGRTTSQLRTRLQTLADYLRGDDRESVLEEVDSSGEYSLSELKAAISRYEEKAVEKGKISEDECTEYKNNDSDDSDEGESDGGEGE